MCPMGPWVAKPKPRVLVLHLYLWSRLQFHWPSVWEQPGQRPVHSDVPMAGVVQLSQ